MLSASLATRTASPQPPIVPLKLCRAGCKEFICPTSLILVPCRLVLHISIGRLQDCKNVCAYSNPAEFILFAIRILLCITKRQMPDSGSGANTRLELKNKVPLSRCSAWIFDFRRAQLTFFSCEAILWVFFQSN